MRKNTLLIILAIIVAGILSGITWSAAQSEMTSARALLSEDLSRRDDRIADLERLVADQRQQIQSLDLQVRTFMSGGAQPTMSASKRNLMDMAAALERYFVDNSAYPIALSRLVPDYVKSANVVMDPCTGRRYIYTSNGHRATSYTLQTPSWDGTQCGTLANGLSYTPGRLMQY